MHFTSFAMTIYWRAMRSTLFTMTTGNFLRESVICYRNPLPGLGFSLPFREGQGVSHASAFNPPFSAQAVV
jgi:hypothetical protein